jgi:hypothetical protein
MTTTPVFIGIDVAKHRLDVTGRPEPAAFQVTNDGPGIMALMSALSRLGLPTGRPGSHRRPRGSPGGRSASPWPACRGGQSTPGP